MKRKLDEDAEFRKEFLSKVGEGSRKTWKEHPEIFKNFRCDWTGRHHTEETKAKMREKGKLHTGEKNSMFGRIWVYNELVRANASIVKNELHDYMEQGWEPGRVYDWEKYFKRKNKMEEVAERKANRKIFKETGKNNPKVNPEQERRIEYYKSLLPIFLHNRWKKFVELTGYKYTSQNFYYQMEVCLRLTRPQLKEMKETCIIEST